jgi:hypothetical protein
MPQVQVINGSTRIVNVATPPALVTPTEEQCRRMLTTFEVYTFRKLNDPSNMIPVKTKKHKKKSSSPGFFGGGNRRESRDRQRRRESTGNSGDTSTGNRASNGKYHLSWERAQRTQESYTNEQVIQMLKKLDTVDAKKGRPVAKKKADLGDNQAKQINELLEEKNCQEYDPQNFVWTLRQLDDTITWNEVIGKHETDTLVAYLKRAPRQDVANMVQLYHTIKMHKEQQLRQQQFAVEQRTAQENAMMQQQHQQMLERQRAQQQGQRIGPQPVGGAGQKKDGLPPGIVIVEEGGCKKPNKNKSPSRSQSRNRRDKDNKKKVRGRDSRGRRRRSRSSDSSRSSNSSRSSRSSSRDSWDSDASESDAYSKTTYSSEDYSRTGRGGRGRGGFRTHEKDGFVVVEGGRRRYSGLPEVPRVTSFERLSPPRSPLGGGGRFATPALREDEAYAQGMRDTLAAVTSGRGPRAIAYHPEGGSNRSNSDASLDLVAEELRLRRERDRIDRLERERLLHLRERDYLPPDDYLTNGLRDLDLFDRGVGRSGMDERILAAEDRIRRDSVGYDPLRVRRGTFDGGDRYFRDVNPFADRRGSRW